VEQPELGEIVLDKTYPTSISLACPKAGISAVYQEATLCPNLSVAENIFIAESLYGMG
jgi:ABC-type sugar transport system ATPase subunit